MRILFIVFGFCWVFGFSCGGQTPVSAPDTLGDLVEDSVGEVAEAPGAPVYAGEVQPMLALYCGPCHTVNGSGGTNFASVYDENLIQSKLCPGKTVGECGLDLIRDGSMPLGRDCSGDPVQDRETAGCLSAGAQELLEDWILGGLLR